MSTPFYAVIPAYNEAASIKRVIRGILTRFPGAIVIVVDDGSTDQTAMAALHAGAQVVQMPVNLGYGVAMQTGLRYASRQNASCVVTLDADGQHDPTQISAILEPVLSGQSDIAIGSRYLSAGAMYRVPVSRRIGSWVFAKIISALTRSRITDPTSGFQCLNSTVVKLYANLTDFPESSPDADMLLYAHLRGLRICEVPVSMYADEGAESMHGFLRSFFYAPKMMVAMAGVLLASRQAGVR